MNGAKRYKLSRQHHDMYEVESNVLARVDAEFVIAADYDAETARADKAVAGCAAYMKAAKVIHITAIERAEGKSAPHLTYTAKEYGEALLTFKTDNPGSRFLDEIERLRVRVKELEESRGTE